MIYILKISKKKLVKNEKIILTVNESKQFICKLGAKDFRINSYIIVGADKQVEIDNILDYFVEDMFEKIKFEIIDDAYLVNEKIEKKNRISVRGASVDSIMKFKQKIKDKIPGYSIDIYFFPDEFEIYVIGDEAKFRVVCSYLLEIKTIYLLGEGTGKDVREVETTINGVFRKQRYYYRKKNEIRT